MDCPHCGALLQENQEICPACGGQVRKRSFWQRLLKFFSPVQVTRTKVIRTSNLVIKNRFPLDKEGGKPVILDDLPPELRAKVQNALASGQTPLISLGEIPAELQAIMKEAIASGKTQYLTLNEMPPELGAKFQEAIASGQGVAKQVISYKGPDGQMHTCQSLEELPEDIQAKFKEAFASGQGSDKQVFTYQSPDGQKHIYHSLEEMPEDVQALFRAASEIPRKE
jgi:hypothetical protein